MRQSLLWVMVGGLLGGSQLWACSDADPSPRTLSEFCEDWADAACSDATVEACQAANAEDCRLSQQEFCRDLVPAGFSDARGDECIDAVSSAYEDADLTSTEIDAVRRLGGPCSGIVTGTRALGQTCETDTDCDRSNGALCVQRGGMRGGVCEIPEEVGPGQSCADPAQTCPAGFFCDGSNCIATKGPGSACQNDVECGSGFCGSNDICVARLAVGSVCSTDEQCESLFCYAAGGQSTCTNLIRLSPAESICSDLR